MTFLASDLLLHQLIERHADQTPDAIAVTCLDSEISYGELDRWANRLAYRLREAGAGPETPVAVVAERCIETVVSLLAVLKAGAAYVPIDPANPPRRFHYLMRDSGARLLVTPERLGSVTPDGEWTVVLSDLDQVAGVPADRLPRTALPDNTAYIIYTSGSTGEPKGVLVTHRQIVHSTAANSELGREDPACFLLLISFSFDANGVGLYWKLATGGQVVIPTPDELSDIRALRALAARHRVTHLDCTPTLYSLILGDDPEPLSTLRCAIVGGEACPRDLVERHHGAADPGHTGRGGPDRQGGSAHPHVHPRRAVPTGGRGCGGRAVHRRRRGRPRLPPAQRADRAELPARSLVAGAGRAHVPHR